MTEFQMHLRWLAEQRRLADLERQWREAEKREAYWALMAMLEDGTDDYDGQNDLNAEGREVTDDGGKNATSRRSVETHG